MKDLCPNFLHKESVEVRFVNADMLQATGQPWLIRLG